MCEMLPYFEDKHMLSGIIVCCGCRRAQNASGVICICIFMYRKQRRNV